MYTHKETSSKDITPDSVIRFVDFADAKELLKQLEQPLFDGKKVILDFEQAKNVDINFLLQSVGILFRKFNEHWLKDHLFIDWAENLEVYKNVMIVFDYSQRYWSKTPSERKEKPETLEKIKLEYEQEMKKYEC